MMLDMIRHLESRGEDKIIGRLKKRLTERAAFAINRTR
jgi:hypothetical protein